MSNGTDLPSGVEVIDDSDVMFIKEALLLVLQNTDLESGESMRIRRSTGGLSVGNAFEPFVYCTRLIGAPADVQRAVGTIKQWA